jgi:hypothetical protein
MPVTENPTSPLESDIEMNNTPLVSAGEGDHIGIARTDYRAVLALACTAAIVAFVGAIVVLTIPYAILSVSLPASVNRLGLSIETTQALFFGQVWYLLIPSALFAVWVGYKFYWWGCNVKT